MFKREIIESPKLVQHPVSIRRFSTSLACSAAQDASESVSGEGTVYGSVPFTTHRAKIKDLTPVIALVKIWLALTPIFVIVGQRLHDIDPATVQIPNLLFIFVVVRKFWLGVKSALGAAQLACGFREMFFGQTSARDRRQREVKVALTRASRERERRRGADGRRRQR